MSYININKYIYIYTVYNIYVYNTDISVINYDSMTHNHTHTANPCSPLLLWTQTKKHKLLCGWETQSVAPNCFLHWGCPNSCVQPSSPKTYQSKNLSETQYITIQKPVQISSNHHL